MGSEGQAESTEQEDAAAVPSQEVQPARRYPEIQWTAAKSQPLIVSAEISNN